MRFGVVIFSVTCLTVILGATGSALAREDQRRAQLQAAQMDAVASLVDQIRATRLTPEMSVGQFLEQTGGEERLRQAVDENAELIGATRWPNPGTCQIRLEVPSTPVLQTLTAIARNAPKKTPLPAEVIEKNLSAPWKGRTFTAIGTSATPEAVEKMRPGPEHPLWLAVPEEDRREAVKAAQRNAARRTIEGLNGIPLGDDKTLSDALEVPAVRDAVQNWVATQPVTNIEFRDNGEVRLTVAAPGEDFWQVLRDALGRQTDVPSPRDEAAWRRLHDDVVGRLRSPVGGQSAVARGARPAPRAATQAMLPERPPEWVEGQLDAEGTAAGGPRIRLVHSAEAEALKDLRTQVEALPLGDGRKLGEEAARNDDVRAAIDRSLHRAKSHKIDWGPRGDSATVHMALDLRHVWQELPHR